MPSNELLQLVALFKLELFLFIKLLHVHYCSVPDDFKVNPGAVEAVAIHPTNPDKVKITKFVFFGGGEGRDASIVHLYDHLSFCGE